MAARATPPRRRTQEERRATTRAALLDATIDCLVEYGYSGVTTNRVVERAGVSRGAQVHHFPTKTQLVAEAVRHLAGRRAAEWLPRLDTLPTGRSRTGAALDLLWESHTDKLFTASLELWVAARTDDELRKELVSVEREVTASVHGSAEEVFGPVARRPTFATDLELVLATMRGLALLRSATGERPKALQARWAATRERLLTLFDS